MSRISQVLRVPLSTRPPLGGSSGTFVLPCRKVVLEYCEKSVASKGMRDFILQQANSFARAHPSVEFVVSPRPQRSPLLRGFYHFYTQPTSHTDLYQNAADSRFEWNEDT